MTIVEIAYAPDYAWTRPEEFMEAYIASLSYLYAFDSRHRIASFIATGFEQTYRHHNVTYEFFVNRGHPYLLPLRLHRKIKREWKPGLVIVHGMRNPLQLMHLRWVLGRGVKIVVWNHGERPSKGIARWLQKRADRAADAYFFTAREQGEDWLSRGVIRSDEKIVEVQEGSSSFSMLPYLESRKTFGIVYAPLVFWVGRLDANKDPLLGILAFKAMRDRFPNAEMRMVYAENALEGELMAQITLLGLDDCVKLLGKLDHAQLATCFSAADIFLAASHYEATGYALCEALSCGATPVVTAIPSFVKLAGALPQARFFDPEDALTAGEMLIDAYLNKKEGDRAEIRRHFEEHLSFESMARKISARFGL